MFDRLFLSLKSTLNLLVCPVCSRGQAVQVTAFSLHLQVSVMCGEPLPVPLVQVPPRLHSWSQHLLLPGGTSQAAWGRQGHMLCVGTSQRSWDDVAFLFCSDQHHEAFFSSSPTLSLFGLPSTKPSLFPPDLLFLILKPIWKMVLIPRVLAHHAEKLCPVTQLSVSSEVLIPASSAESRHILGHSPCQDIANVRVLLGLAGLGGGFHPKIRHNYRECSTSGSHCIYQQWMTSPWLEARGNTGHAFSPREKKRMVPLSKSPSYWNLESI